jgi:hypothetical protein
LKISTNSPRSLDQGRVPLRTRHRHPEDGIDHTFCLYAGPSQITD